MRRTVAAGLSLALLTPFPAFEAGAVPPGAPNCRLFPRNSVWHADISKLPVHPRSAAWLDSMEAGTSRLHPDFGPSFGKPRPYGIPYDVVGAGHADVSVTFEYDDESDPGPYPVGDDTTIEMGSDRHALIVDRDTCTLYELFALRRVDGAWHAGSGAIWDLDSNVLRPAGWTSADAAGLPILAGVLRKDEVEAGFVDHAIRVTASRTSRRYLWPARHQAGSADDPNVPPMGARFRLRAGFDIGGFREDTRVVLRAMKRYGLILADNGSDWYFTGTSEAGWDNDMLDELKTVPASAFVAVDASSLRMSASSGRAKQPVALTLHASADSAEAGTAVALSARMTPAHPGRRVVVERRACETCPWIAVRERELDGSSQMRVSVAFDYAGARQFRAVSPADGDHLAGRSVPTRVSWM